MQTKIQCWFSLFLADEFEITPLSLSLEPHDQLSPKPQAIKNTNRNI
jgi:hypothetical protein